MTQVLYIFLTDSYRSNLAPCQSSVESAPCDVCVDSNFEANQVRFEESETCVEGCSFWAKSSVPYRACRDGI